MLVFAFLLAGVLLYFTLRGLDWVAFGATITSGRYEFLLLTIPIASINFLIRAARWGIRWLALKKKFLSLSIFWANMVGYLGNTFLPARAG